MQIEKRSLEASATAPHWCDPLAMLIAWLAYLFDQIAGMKRIRHNTRFKPNWRDNFDGLRQCEWLRDQMLAAGAAHLLAGGSLDEDTGFIPSTEPPANYGGPCPRTPQEMNRRFLAVARFNADPEAAIRKHAQRIAKRAGIDLSNPLAAHGSTNAALCAAAHHELVSPAPLLVSTATLALILSSARSARPSKDERGHTHPRGPPRSHQSETPTSQPPARTPPHACRIACAFIASVSQTAKPGASVS